MGQNGKDSVRASAGRAVRELRHSAGTPWQAPVVRDGCAARRGARSAPHPGNENMRAGNMGFSMLLCAVPEDAMGKGGRERSAAASWSAAVAAAARVARSLSSRWTLSGGRRRRVRTARLKSSEQQHRVFTGSIYRRDCTPVQGNFQSKAR